MPTVKELRAEAKRRGMTGYSKMRKAELEKLLRGKGKSKEKSKKGGTKPCPTGKERNPSTGRCRNACPPGKDRNPATGRCKGAKSKPKPNRPKTKPSKAKDCSTLLRENDIRSKRDFLHWARRGGHPDKGGSTATFQTVSNCMDLAER